MIMNKIKVLYEKNFRLTGESSDISDINFKFHTYMRETLDASGNPALREFFMSYNATTETFSDLAVKCTYTYTMNAENVITRSVENIEWYFEDGTLGTTKQMIKVFIP